VYRSEPVCLCSSILRNASEFAVNGQVAEHVAAGAVVEIRDGAKNPPLRAFAGAGRANEQYGAVFTASTFASLCRIARTESPRTDHDFAEAFRLQLHVHFVHGMRADPFADILAAHALTTRTRSFSVSLGSCEKAGDLVSKKRPVESELASV